MCEWLNSKTLSHHDVEIEFVIYCSDKDQLDYLFPSFDPVLAGENRERTRPWLWWKNQMENFTCSLDVFNGWLSYNRLNVVYANKEEGRITNKDKAFFEVKGNLSQIYTARNWASILTYHRCLPPCTSSSILFACNGSRLSVIQEFHLTLTNFSALSETSLRRTFCILCIDSIAQQPSYSQVNQPQ